MKEYFCLGVEAFGLCEYNPSSPQNVYFDIGSAVAALGFTLAIQQILKPIYEFRFRTYGVRFWYLIIAVFIGVVCVLIASILPSLPVSKDKFFSYPIVWEFFAGFIIFFVYAIAASMILVPVRIWDFNLITFVRSAATFLTKANTDEKILFVSDLSENIEKLFKYAQVHNIVERKSSRIEFERLRNEGKNLEIRGRAPICPFVKFRYRRELELSNYANSFLQILADSDFCKILVKECPWHIAGILNTIEEKKLYTEGAKNFIQELAKQAIINDESMMAREMSYDGFGAAPVLSNSLFASPHILRMYRPLNKFIFLNDSYLTEGFVSRLSAASEKMLSTALLHHGFWETGYMYDVKSAYESISQHIGWGKKEENDSRKFDSQSHIGISKLYKMILESLEQEKRENVGLLFKKSEEHSNHSNLVELVAEITFDSLENISNGFTDFHGRFWFHSIEVYHDIYSPIRNNPLGLNPLQQHLAIKLIDKLKDNMDGYYPSLSKVLIAIIGPYKKEKFEEGTAGALLQDAVYNELKRLSDLYKKSPDKIESFLPSNVKYDPNRNTLVHEGRNKSIVETNLSDLNITAVDFYDSKNWNLAS